MIIFYIGVIEVRNVEYSNYKFSFDKIFFILFKLVEVSLFGFLFLIGFGFGFLGGGGLCLN